MDPICSLCGARHHPRQSHRWAEGASSAVSSSSHVTNRVTNGANSSAGGEGEVARVLRWREENRERYRETQRELMRARRAKARAGFSEGST